MSALTVKEVPLLLPIAGLQPYGGPCKTIAYDLVEEGRLVAVKQGDRTCVTGESFVAYINSLPAFDPKKSSRGWHKGLRRKALRTVTRNRGKRTRAAP